MLQQTLQAQGMKVEWFERMDEEPSGKANEKAAAWIKKVSRARERRQLHLPDA